MNCVLYARVSTDRQAQRELSIPAQLKAMGAYAHQHGWQVTGTFVDAGVSGRSAQRPQLQALLTRCRQRDQKVDVVVVHKVDRLARNVYDHSIIRSHFREQGIRLASVVEPVDDSITGRLVEHIMASIAEFYSANLAEEIKKGMRMMIEQGGWPHKPPRGYLNARDTAGRPTIVIDERMARSVRRVFELYATGKYSFRQVEATLRDEGMPIPVSGRALRRLLSNPFYVGTLLWKDQKRDGNHPALIASELFNTVAEQLRKRRHSYGRRAIHPFILRGLARCARCGRKVTSEQHGRWGYYRCPSALVDGRACRARYSNADRVHAQLKSIYEELSIPATQVADEEELVRSVFSEIVLEASQIVSWRLAPSPAD